MEERQEYEKHYLEDDLRIAQTGDDFAISRVYSWAIEEAAEENNRKPAEHEGWRNERLSLAGTVILNAINTYSFGRGTTFRTWLINKLFWDLFKYIDEDCYYMSSKEGDEDGDYETIKFRALQKAISKINNDFNNIHQRLPNIDEIKHRLRQDNPRLAEEKGIIDIILERPRIISIDELGQRGEEAMARTRDISNNREEEDEGNDGNTEFGYITDPWERQHEKERAKAIKKAKQRLITLWHKKCIDVLKGKPELVKIFEARYGSYFKGKKVHRQWVAGILGNEMGLECAVDLLMREKEMFMILKKEGLIEEYFINNSD